MHRAPIAVQLSSHATLYFATCVRQSARRPQVLALLRITAVVQIRMLSQLLPLLLLMLVLVANPLLLLLLMLVLAAKRTQAVMLLQPMVLPLG